MSKSKRDLQLYLRLLRYVTPYWRMFTLAMLCMILLAATAPALAALVEPMIDGAFIKNDPDTMVRGYSQEDATKMVLGSMYDYTHYITPQFSRTDINFQRVPTVDTSNPFAATEIPTNDQSFSVIHIRNLKKIKVDFRGLLKMLEGSFMSTPDTIVVPAGKKIFAMQLILTPLINELMQKKQFEG